MASVYIDNLTGVAYTYDDGCLTEITRTDEETDLEQYYTFVYDAWGNTTQIKVGNRTLATYTYADGNGNLETMTYGNGVVVNYEYDKFDRVETVECDGYETRYYYSAEGSLERTEDEKSGRTTYYIYDGIGRLVRSTAYEDGDIVEDEVYCYDDLNRTSEVFTKAGTHENTQSYTYDTSDGSLTKLENEYGSTTDVVEYTYDYLKRLSEKEISNGDGTLTYRYSFADNPTDNTKTTTNISSVIISKGEDSLDEFHYEYDNIGNIISEDNFGTDEVTYKYDELGQLVEVDDSRRAEVYKYYYDNFGNILKKETYKNDSLQSTYEYGYTDSNWRDLLTSYRGHAITYDAIGNPLSYYNGSSYTFTWTEGRKLASATLGSTNVSYNYENGNRVSKTVGEIVHNYYYISGNLVSETWDGKSISFLYDESGVYGFIYNNGTTTETYYYGKNLQGDIIDIYDDEMNLVTYYEYDAWGKLNAIYDDNGDTINARTNTTHPAVVNPLRYRSYYYDTETSLYFLNSRYYDAKVGRFISADSLIDNRGIITQNLFQYCGNNPVNNADPSGNLFGIIGVGLLIVGLVSILSRYLSKSDTTPPSSSPPSNPSAPSNPSSPESLTEEQKHFVSVIAGEAIGANTKTQKAVAHTIMNRVNEPRDVWCNATSVSEVLISAQYNAVGSAQYIECMSYLNNRDGSNILYEELIAAVIPIYYGYEADFTGGAHYIFNVNGSAGLLRALESQPERYVKCGPFSDISDTEYRMYRCLW